MNKYIIEIAKAENFINVIWDGDCFPEPIEADSVEEAVEFARDYLNDNGENADEFILRITKGEE